ncbi:uncharacterized protein LOC126782646 [Argentina anserina]|uniref:uncharacterized protein LOC126782646 n=1 Tax=Argentina anserina TaxID=57926 RepID=UPI0021762964|nr:uncharacterized protein LOC126782646 [Potentilla anserina]
MCDHHLSSISFDPTAVSIPSTPCCKRCQHSTPKGNWFCLSCKDIFCCTSVKGHFYQHYEETKHCLCLNCKCQHPTPKGNWFCLSCKDVFCCASVNGHFYKHYDETKHCLCVNCSTKSFWCCSCRKTLDAQVIQQLWVKGRSTSSKLENIDAMIVDVIDLLSKPFPSINVYPQLDAQSFVSQDELALAKQGLQKIFDDGLEAVADPIVEEEFLLYSATLLSAKSCPSELKVNLSSFSCNLSEDTSAFIKAQDELKIASDLSASINQKKFVVRQQTSKYDEVKKELTASDKKVTSFKAMIKDLEIKRLEACLATEESNRAKIDEAIDFIEKQVTTARDELVSDLAHVPSMEGTIQAATQLVTQKQSDWDNLKLSFTKFA